MISSVGIALLINVLTSIFKRFVYPKFGRIGVQIVVFILALIGAVYITYGQQIAELKTIVTSAITLFTTAVVFYEVILQYIPTFKQETTS